jgi:hypothetical protein
MGAGWTPRPRCSSGWPRSTLTGPRGEARLTNSPEEAGPDLVRIVEVLDRHGVEYLIVGGIAARAYGAARETQDLDCVIRRSRANLAHLADALVELHAYLRVGGMSDDEMRALPVRVDSETLARSEMSTWRTDAGDIDLLADIPTGHGTRRTYDELLAGSARLDTGGIEVLVASLDDVVKSKEWANREKDRAALPELRQLLREVSHQKRSES